VAHAAHRRDPSRERLEVEHGKADGRRPQVPVVRAEEEPVQRARRELLPGHDLALLGAGEVLGRERARGEE